MNNNTRSRFKALTKEQRQDIAAAGAVRKSKFPKVARKGPRGN